MVIIKDIFSNNSLFYHQMFISRIFQIVVFLLLEHLRQLLDEFRMIVVHLLRRRVVNFWYFDRNTNCNARNITKNKPNLT